jgi:NADH:ubiquinone oxidoreductase subunit E
METIEVKICSGTTCFVMGSSYLNDLYDIIPQKYGDKVIVKPSLCLGQCSKSDKHSKAPYVKINGEVISEATVEKILSAIEQRIGANEE